MIDMCNSYRVAQTGSKRNKPISSTEHVSRVLHRLWWRLLLAVTWSRGYRQILETTLCAVAVRINFTVMKLFVCSHQLTDTSWFLVFLAECCLLFTGVGLCANIIEVLIDHPVTAASETLVLIFTCCSVIQSDSLRRLPSIIYPSWPKVTKNVLIYN